MTSDDNDAADVPLPKLPSWADRDRMAPTCFITPWRLRGDGTPPKTRLPSLWFWAASGCVNSEAAMTDEDRDFYW